MLLKSKKIKKKKDYSRREKKKNERKKKRKHVNTLDKLISILIALENNLQ